MSDYWEKIESVAKRLGEAALRKQVVMATAESCTAGGIAYAMTEVAGSSAWFDRGFVTYTNASKEALLGVKSATLMAHGAVSLPVVEEMTAGALEQSDATLAVAVSGIAGPGGAVPGKPVGTVCMAWQWRGEAAQSRCEYFSGDRKAVREQTILYALNGLLERILMR
ncbi:MAG: CinA family protein [Burkholderiaceae bacterium]|nr:CinA family protein [Burkholderiaceae bacterium]